MIPHFPAYFIIYWLMTLVGTEKDIKSIYKSIPNKLKANGSSNQLMKIDEIYRSHNDSPNCLQPIVLLTRSSPFIF